MNSPQGLSDSKVLIKAPEVSPELEGAGPLSGDSHAQPMELTTASNQGWFASTHWSVVLAAAESHLPEGGSALEKLCRIYWKPLFAYARGFGNSEHDAQDLTQGFFEQFLQKGYIRAADPRRGRFRSFLLTSFRHFTTKEWAKARATKRGGRVAFVSLEELTPSESAHFSQPSSLIPEAAYDREWALRVFDLALGRLRDEFAAASKKDQFDQLKPFLSRLGTSADYSVVGKRCGLSEGAIAVAVRRLRARYGELLRAEVANTVASPADIEDELELLRKSLIA